MKIFGIRCLYNLNMTFFELNFCKGFNELQIINMIDDIYSNLHIAEYKWQYQIDNGVELLWKDIDTNYREFRKKLETKEIKIGFCSLINISI